MAHDTPMRPATQVVHAGQSPEATTGAVMPPIFTSTTYAQEAPGVHKGLDYIRAHNPTRYALERMMALLEGSTITQEQDVTHGGFAFASGMASIATVLELLDQGAHVVTMDDLYGGTNRLLNRVRKRTRGLDVSMADLSDPANLESVMRKDTRLVFCQCDQRV